ncbi:PDR/VanB family oxidoreductase [Novosphingobium sp. 9]|uniref:PDR/VanB family oxidoreductase n=1 Tax=Novosphingobium sp. 9 TaxID=2025349 RepID=UPI0021B4E058|nr:PDR/VanB family oxidoreductase [Novosphingobium sp. 9]
MQGHLIDVVVRRVRQLTPRVREYLLASVDGSALPRGAPGAHVELHTASPSTGPVVRHYSLIGGEGLADDPADTYRIAVQREDRQRGSAHIHATFEEGTRLKVSRPKNNFPLDRRDHRSLLIAGGIGVTPIYAMLRSLVRRQRPFELVYAGRTYDQLAYADEIAALAGAQGRLHFSGDPAVDHLDIPALLAAQSDDTTVYVCGPAAMIEATHAAAEALGWGASRVRSEMFTAGPAPDDAPFEVELRRTGRTVSVGRDVSILDALAAEGIDMLSDCRRGECGLCPLPVIGGGDRIDHRDRYLSDEERAACDTLCICVSRARGTLVLDA